MQRFQYKHNYKQADRGALQTSRSYLFEDKKPIIDDIRELMRAHGTKHKELAEASRVSLSTLRNWDLGKTRSPQGPTMNAVLRVYGKKLGIVDL